MGKAKAARRHFSVWGISIFLALVFIVAAIAKIESYEDFQVTLSRSQLLGTGYANTVAPLIIGVELATAFGLLIPKLRRFALPVVAALCCVFISYSAWRWARHISVPCSCFGALFRMTPPQAIALNLGLLGLATLLFRFQETTVNAPKAMQEPKSGQTGRMPLKT